MKRTLQLYIVAVGVHVIFVALYFATEHVPWQTDGFLAPGLLGVVLFPCVRAFERLVTPTTFERFAFVALVFNTLAWASIVQVAGFVCRAVLVSIHTRHTT